MSNATETKPEAKKEYPTALAPKGSYDMTVGLVRVKSADVPVYENGVKQEGVTRPGYKLMLRLDFLEESLGEQYASPFISLNFKGNLSWYVPKEENGKTTFTYTIHPKLDKLLSAVFPGLPEAKFTIDPSVVADMDRVFRVEPKGLETIIVNVDIRHDTNKVTGKKYYELSYFDAPTDKGYIEHNLMRQSIFLGTAPLPESVTIS